MITDDAGAVYQHLEYSPYGETWVEEGGSNGNTPGYKFTGKELDPETGLYYYGARYYDPVLSRWISADPALGRYFGGSPNGGVFAPLNLGLFTYSFGNPVRYMDPTGQFPAETGGKYDYFRTSNSWTGNWLLDNTVVGLYNDASNLSGLVLNNALNVLGYTNEGAHWLVTDVLGGSEADYEALGVFFMVEGAPLAQSMRLETSAAKMEGAATEAASATPKIGSAGGPGAGKNFSQGVKNAARSESNNTCVFCGTETTRTPSPTQSNIDHAIPKSRGGNNLLDNAQNTCRDCNLQKGTQTTEEFLEGQ